MEAIKKIRKLEHIKLAAVFIGLNILDIVLTQIILNSGGSELNPLMRYLFEQLGWGVWVIRLGTVITVALMLLWCAPVRPRIVKIAFISSIVLMSAVCLYNGVGLIS